MKYVKHRGMYLETILNQTFQRYERSEIAVFRKQSLPIKIHQINQKEIIGELVQKCDDDYYGICEGKFIAIEAKQTVKDDFNFLQIQDHQQSYLSLIAKCKGLSFLVIYFEKYDEFYLIEFLKLLEYRTINNTNKIPRLWIQNHSQLLNLYFPGYLDLIEKIKTSHKD